jgi:hypothetical protein
MDRSSRIMRGLVREFQVQTGQEAEIYQAREDTCGRKRKKARRHMVVCVVAGHRRHSEIERTNERTNKRKADNTTGRANATNHSQTRGQVSRTRVRGPRIKGSKRSYEGSINKRGDPKRRAIRHHRHASAIVLALGGGVEGLE